MRPPPSWPSPWRCWSAGPPASTAACPPSGWATGGCSISGGRRGGGWAGRGGGGGWLGARGRVGALRAAGLPPAHVGVAAGPVVAQGGDYFGRTVNLAARIAAYASAGRVLVSEPVIQRAPPQGVTFVEAGEVELKGFADPVRLLEARRA